MSRGVPPPPGHNINKTTKLTTGLHRGLFAASLYSSTPWPKGRRIYLGSTVKLYVRTRLKSEQVSPGAGSQWRTSQAVLVTKY